MDSMEVKLFKILKKNLLFILIGALLISSAVVVYNKSKFVPKFSATVTILISSQGGEDESNLEGINRNQQLVPTYAKLALSSKVLENVLKDERFSHMNIEMIRSMVSIQENATGQFIDIYANGEKDIVVPLSIKVAESLKTVGIQVRKEDLVSIINIPSNPIQTNSFHWERIMASSFFISLFFIISLLYVKTMVVKK